MQTAKLFTNGRSQAVRLPRDCQFSGSNVYVRKFEGMVMLLPKRSAWTPLLKSLDMFSHDFMNHRNQPKQQKRKKIL